MRLMHFEKAGKIGLAAAAGAEFMGLAEDSPDYPGPLEALLAAGVDLREAGRKLMAKGSALDLEQVTFLPPLRRPGKIICLGLNYQEHSEEFGQKEPKPYPEVFGRFPSSLVGHQGPLLKSPLSDSFDYEGELAMVIGRGGRNIPRAEALGHVAAYSIFNDGTMRDFQWRVGQWTMGKNFDHSGAFGPWLVTSDSLPEGARGLSLTTRLNGTVFQKATTSDMIFDVAAQIEYVSQAMTLEPGDVFVTGTPGGVGHTRKPPVYMGEGDVCEVEIEEVGLLRNPVVLDRR